MRPVRYHHCETTYEEYDDRYTEMVTRIQLFDINHERIQLDEESHSTSAVKNGIIHCSQDNPFIWGVHPHHPTPIAEVVCGLCREYKIVQYYKHRGLLCDECGAELGYCQVYAKKETK